MPAEDSSEELMKARRLTEVHHKALEKVAKACSRPDLILQSFEVEPDDPRVNRLMEVQKSLVKAVSDHAKEDLLSIHQEYDIVQLLNKIDRLEARDVAGAEPSSERKRRRMKPTPPKTPAQRIKQKEAVYNREVQTRLRELLQRLNKENEDLSDSLIRQRKKLQDTTTVLSKLTSTTAEAMASSMS